MVDKKISGFMLIELLLVIGMIAILIAIAIPNFITAQTRTRVARQKARMAASIPAIAAYRVDNTAYPPCRIGTMGQYLYEFPIEVTTPIAYMRSRPLDYFETYQSQRDSMPVRYTKPGWGYNNGFLIFNIYADYPKNFDNPDPSAAGTIRISCDTLAPISYGVWGEVPNTLNWNTAVDKQPFFKTSWYDPTNGIMSRGFLVNLPGGITSS
ncbi:MAG: type II secretion system protein [bacterium]